RAGAAARAADRDQVFDVRGERAQRPVPRVAQVRPFGLAPAAVTAAGAGRIRGHGVGPAPVAGARPPSPAPAALAVAVVLQRGAADGPPGSVRSGGADSGTTPVPGPAGRRRVTAGPFGIMLCAG